MVDWASGGEEMSELVVGVRLLLRLADSAGLLSSGWCCGGRCVLGGRGLEKGSLVVDSLELPAIETGGGGLGSYGNGDA